MQSAPDQAQEDAVAIEVSDILDATPKTAVARFDPLRAGLQALNEKFSSYTPDLSTAAGEKEARSCRQELVKIRTSATKVYEQLNAPLLEAQRQARKIRDEIVETAEKFERPIDQAIKAKEAEREAEKKRKAEEEAARIKAIRDRIANIASIPVAAVSLNSEQIQAVINDLGNSAFTQERFGEFLDEAEELATQIGHKLSEMRDAAAAREAEALRLAAERAELERLRAEQAERDRKVAEQRAAEEAAAAAKLKKEQDELAAQRAAFQAEQDAAAARAREAEEAVRKRNAEEAERHQAFLRKQQDAFEEERRAELERQQREAEALAAERAELQRKERELAAVSAPAPASAAAPEPQPEAQESFLPPVEQQSHGDLAVAAAAEMIDTAQPYYDAPPADTVTDFQVLDAVAAGFNWTLREALERIKVLDLSTLAEIVADSEVPA